MFAGTSKQSISKTAMTRSGGLTGYTVPAVGFQWLSVREPSNWSLIMLTYSVGAGEPRKQPPNLPVRRERRRRRSPVPRHLRARAMNRAGVGDDL